jgi:hypothetical protein
MRVTTTIPAEGIQKPVKLTGRSLIVESSGVYTKVSEVPTFSFNPGSKGNPIYPRSVYVNSEGLFNQIVIEGTAESEGDEITLYSTDECLTTDLNINLIETVEKVIGDSQEEVLSGTVFQFSALSILNADGKSPSSVYLTATGGPVHYAFNVDPEDDSGNLYSVIAVDEVPIEISGLNNILNLRFLNADTTTPADSHLVYFFEY